MSLTTVGKEGTVSMWLKQETNVATESDMDALINFWVIDKEWHNIAATYNEDTAILYIDLIPRGVFQRNKDTDNLLTRFISRLGDNWNVALTVLWKVKLKFREIKDYFTHTNEELREPTAEEMKAIWNGGKGLKYPFLTEEDDE